MKIQSRVDDANRTINDLQEKGELTKQILAVGIEMNQRYLEYLDDLESADLKVSNGVYVSVDGQTVKFDNLDDFSAWVAEHGNE